MPTELTAVQATDVCTHHGEGPVWDADLGVLRFVDLLAGSLMTLDPRTGAVTRRELGRVAACVRPRAGGGLVVALERSLALLDGDAAPRLTDDVWSDPGIRFNDGGCDPAGRFWVGTMAYDERPGAGTLYRLDADLTVTAVLQDVTISNGLSFSADGTRAFYVDTPTSRVDVLEIDPDVGVITGRRPWVEIPPDLGHPDGIAVDSGGGVWVALWGGSAVHRYDADGRLDVVVHVPAGQVSCPAFGGPDLSQLYITTSRQHLTVGVDPLAGAVFRVDPGHVGVPVLPFAG